MAVADVLRVFRDLKREGTVRDYILFGSVAVMVHTRPFFTQDVGIGVAVSDDQEFLQIFNRLADFGTVQGHSIVTMGIAHGVDHVVYHALHFRCCYPTRLHLLRPLRQ